MPPNHALIFGASGISGWAITSQALTYPTRTTFARVTALTNRPLTHAASALPHDPRLTLINGIDLTATPASVKALLTAKVPDIASVTHVFFAAYSPHADAASDQATNVAILRTAVTAITALSKAIQHITLQTGGKWYGIGRPDLFGKQPGPYAEDAPRHPPPHDVHIFYYAQHDALRSLCDAQAQELNPGPEAPAERWTWSELRPNAIIGFAPTGPVFMHTALALGIYLSLVRATSGPGARVPFPGSTAAWSAPVTDCAADTLARAHLFTALDARAKAVGPAFNVADARAPSCWGARWGGICAYFGLEGTAPPSDADPMVDRMGGFVKGHEGVWEGIVSREGLVSAGWVGRMPWVNFWGLLNLLDWHTGLDTGRIRGAGFDGPEDVEGVKGFVVAFERMRAAKQIPA